MKKTYALAALNHKTQPNRKVIYLRVTTNRKPKYKSLKITINSKNWDAKNKRVYSKEPNAQQINETLEQILLDAQAHKTTLIGKSENSFINYANSIIQTTHNSSTKNNRKLAINKLQTYLSHRGKSDIKFNEINNLFVQSYYSWLINDSNVSNSTANEYMQILNQLIDNTQRSGKYIWDSHPFYGYKRKKTETVIEVLNDNEIKLLSEYTPKTRSETITLNSFFFMMHLSGIRISDALQLMFRDFYVDEKNRLMVKYQIQKTGREMKTKVSLEAGLHLVNFITGYFNELQNEIDKLKTEYVKIKNIIKNDKKEMDGIFIGSFQYLKQTYDSGNIKSVEHLLNQETKKETRKEYLRFEIMNNEEKLQKLNNKIFNLIIDAILKLKEVKPNDTLLPQLRGIYYGQTKIDKKVLKKIHSAKTSNNTILQRVGKSLGIRKPVTNHQARHIFAMRLFLNGYNMHHVSLALGHSSLAVTDNYRQKLADDSLHEITDDFSNTFN